MNDADQDNPQLPSAEAPAEAPKKRTRTRKPVSAAAEEAPAGAAAPEAAAEAAKPARKPRAPRKTAAAAVEPVSMEAAESPQAPEADGGSQQVAPQEAVQDVRQDVPMPVASAEASPQAAAQSPEEGEGAEDGAGGRSRNRRRGRRGAGRGEDTEGGETTQAQGAEMASVPPAEVGELFASVVAGDFDGAVEPEAMAETGEAVAEKRVLLPDADAPKLHKVLAQSGIGSRRDMEQMIQDGRVTVNDEVAHTGMRVSFGDRVAVDGKPVRIRIAPPPARVIAYHKLAGEVVSHDDPQQRPTVFRKLPRLQQGKWQSVGRLDMNTEGLLLLTTSGDLANKLMHPRFGVEREYAVRVLGTLEKEARERLLAGVEIEGQAAAFKSIEDGGGEGVNHWYRVVITEGRNREVRKLFDAVGLTVSRLIRIRYGCVVLPRGLKRGDWVDLGEADVKALRRLTDGAGAPRGEGRREGRDAQGGRPVRGDDRGGKKGRGNEQRRERPEGRAEGARPENARGNRNNNSNDKRRREQGDLAPQREPGDPSRIPNPLQQTYDRRAIQRERAASVRDDDFEDGPIPNPLQQTYDRRFVQENRGGGRGGKGKGGGGGGGNQRQPDPMQTSVGYIGADAFTRKLQGRGGGGGGRGRR
ncbi:pseudouridine synthase [Ideonella oryzae]|uniref:Pseudouridine synthase n=1 Tax=Ideonella oryzae TaxID=2937441 RepID=A0ABT1BJY1_9BURK|nr:pseudouridine synthase [Ideonella oryzae]MCO5976518.1 pseudouridine synthase [Ideonella oryzae]